MALISCPECRKEIIKNLSSFTFLAFVVLIIVSCSQTNEDKIITAFKNYVQTNFDDPSQLAEIVSIEQVDTFSTLLYKKTFRDMCKRNDSLKVLADNYQENILSLLGQYGNRLSSISGFSDALMGFRDAVQQYQDFMEPYMTAIYRGETKDMLVADEFDALCDTVFITSEIKYRLKRSNELKLESIKCYSDTCYNNFVFENQKLKDDYWERFCEIFSKNSDYIAKSIGLRTEIVNRGNYLIMLVKDNMK